MAIKEGDIIKVEYVGTFDDGTIFDSTEANGDIPLKFEVGTGQIIPGFDNSVVGKHIGDEFNIRLEPSEAYGEYKEGMTQSISKDQFPPEQEPKAGLMILLMGPQGQPVPATIKEVEDDIVIIDSNHPMAGKVLNFKIKIIEKGCEPDPPHACGCGHDHDHDHEH
ncbi:MAG: peptidylprolyl isomerase [Promethearchaeota archaeon Loki_b32]|nr:MAG: peptidylprolyl isomerase [Candidatus Lokiarchaeota archaeon Loki_b32]